MQLALILIALASAQYNEAPMLRELVQAGELPPVEQRLPENPMVVRPYEKIGVYGGRMNVITGAAQNLNESQYLLYYPLVRFAADGKTIVPNLASKWEMSADGKVFTIYLRRGLKWSDGHPATTEDVQFAWEDVMLNEELMGVPPQAYRVNNKPMKLEIVDKYTFRMIYDEPFGSLPYFLTRGFGESNLIQPKHYLKHYHPRYTDKAKLTAMAKQRDFDRWYELFDNVNYAVNSPTVKMPPDFPTLSPWQVAETPSTGHTILRRNPYHWQVDPQGNQLPYIDEIYSEFVGNPEARNLKFATGQIDFGMSFVRFDNSPLFLSNRKRGNYRVFFWKENQGTRVAYYFNQTHADPQKRKLFQNPKFRIALSYAINRDEINDIVYYGQALPRQDTVNRVSSFFEPEFETAYAQYDPAKAERLLDEIGFKRRRMSKWRSLPDGTPLVIILDAFPVEPYQKTAALIKEYWQAVGVLLNYRTVQGSLVTTRVSANQHDVVGYPNDTATDVMVINEALLGIGHWAPLWAKWLRSRPDRRQGEEPPAHIKELYDVWRQLRSEIDPIERVRLGKRIVRFQAENLIGIGTVGESLGPAVVSNRLHNVPLWMVDESGRPIVGKRALIGWPWLATFQHHPEQWYLQE